MLPAKATISIHNSISGPVIYVQEDTEGFQHEIARFRVPVECMAEMATESLRYAVYNNLLNDDQKHLVIQFGKMLDQSRKLK